MTRRPKAVSAACKEAHFAEASSGAQPRTWHVDAVIFQENTSTKPVSSAYTVSLDQASPRAEKKRQQSPASPKPCFEACRTVNRNTLSTSNRSPMPNRRRAAAQHQQNKHVASDDPSTSDESRSTGSRYSSEREDRSAISRNNRHRSPGTTSRRQEEQRRSPASAVKPRAHRHNRREARGHLSSSGDGLSDEDVEADSLGLIGSDWRYAMYTPSASYRQFDVVTGSHQYTISGYTLARAMGTGTRLCSDLFDAGGQLFRVEVYPSGFTADSRQYLSVFLTTPGSITPNQILYEVGVLDQSGRDEHIMATRAAGDVHRRMPLVAQHRGVIAAFPRLVRARTLLEQAQQYLPGDMLVIRATVQVLQAWSSQPAASSCHSHPCGPAVLCSPALPYCPTQHPLSMQQSHCQPQAAMCGMCQCAQVSARQAEAPRAAPGLPIQSQYEPQMLYQQPQGSGRQQQQQQLYDQHTPHQQPQHCEARHKHRFAEAPPHHSLTVMMDTSAATPQLLRPTHQPAGTVQLQPVGTSYTGTHANEGILSDDSRTSAGSSLVQSGSHGGDFGWGSGGGTRSLGNSLGALLAVPSPGSCTATAMSYHSDASHPANEMHNDGVLHAEGQWQYHTAPPHYHVPHQNHELGHHMY